MTTTEPAAGCGACGAELNEYVGRTTRRLIQSLDAARSALLSVTYQGMSPEVLCASCMNLTIGVLNGVNEGGVA